MVVRLPAVRRRRQLLDVAQELFAAHGFHDTSMDEVAEAAGVTKPVLYQHFGSKRQLYLELLADVGEQLVEALGKAAAEAASPHQQVIAGFSTYFRFVAEHPSAFKLLFASGVRRDPEFSSAARHVERLIADAVASQIRADIDDDHRRLLAYAVVGLAEGVSRLCVSGAEIGDPDVMGRRIAELAWSGFRGVRRD